MAYHIKGDIFIRSNNTRIRQLDVAGTAWVDLPYINASDKLVISTDIDMDAALDLTGAVTLVGSITQTGSIALSGDVVAEGAVVAKTLDFNHVPITHQEDGSVATDVDDEINVHQYGDFVLYCHNIGTQTLYDPRSAALGVDYSGDQTDNDGFGISTKLNGGKGVLNRDYFVVGTSPAFAMSMKYSIAVVAGMDRNIVGFRKDEAVQDDYEDFDEKACIGNIGGDIKISSTINGASDVVTDTTDDWANNETHTLKVLVSSAGVVTYLIDGVAPTVTAAFTFDDGEIVVPCFQFEHASASQAGALVLQELKCGLQ